MKTKDISGLGVALITPFHDDLSVDYNALKNLIEHIVANGADFIVVLGTTGESALLTIEEKKEVTAFVAREVTGRIPLVMGYGGLSTMELVKNMAYTDFSGYSALLTVTPFYLKPSQEGLIRHFDILANHSPLPIILYNVPGRTGVNMLSSTTLQLARTNKKIIGIKEASGRLFQIEEILKDRPEEFKLFSGDDALTFHLATLGAEGVISVMANAFPDKVKTIIEYCKSGEMEKARKIHYKLKNLNKLLFSDGNPAGIKYLLHREGLCKNVLRLPLTSVSVETAKEIDNALKICD